MENALITWRDLLRVGAPAAFGDQLAGDRRTTDLSGEVVLVSRSGDAVRRGHRSLMLW
jgi:hypothetical protein